jgi:hypothetical protein
MTNLDYVISGVSTYDEVAEQFQELLNGLYQLDRDHPTLLSTDLTAVHSGRRLETWFDPRPNPFGLVEGNTYTITKIGTIKKSPQEIDPPHIYVNDIEVGFSSKRFRKVNKNV